MRIHFYCSKFDEFFCKRAKNRWPLNVFCHQKSGFISTFKNGIRTSIIHLNNNHGDSMISTDLQFSTGPSKLFKLWVVWHPWVDTLCLFRLHRYVHTTRQENAVVRRILDYTMTYDRFGISHQITPIVEIIFWWRKKTKKKKIDQVTLPRMIVSGDNDSTRVGRSHTQDDKISK